MGFSVSASPNTSYKAPSRKVHSAPANIYLSSSGYIFRLKIPNDLKKIVGKGEFRYSLRTGSLRIAKQRSLYFSAYIQQLFSRAAVVTGPASRYWRPRSPSAWRPAMPSMFCRRRLLIMAPLRLSTPTKAANSPPRHSSKPSMTVAASSVWMAGDRGETMFLWNDCGDPSNTRRSISMPMTQLPRPAGQSCVIWIGTTAADHTPK